MSYIIERYSECENYLLRMHMERLKKRARAMPPCEVCGKDTYEGNDGLPVCEGCNQAADACTCEEEPTDDTD